MEIYKCPDRVVKKEKITKPLGDFYNQTNSSARKKNRCFNRGKWKK